MLDYRPRQPRDVPEVMRFQSTHQRMIDRRYKGLDSCHARRLYSKFDTVKRWVESCVRHLEIGHEGFGRGTFRWVARPATNLTTNTKEQ